MKDYLWPHLRDLPYFRAMLRAVEARFYDGLDIPAPALDLGCGDGHFASIAFERRLEVGIDPWSGPLQLAAERKAYRLPLRGLGDSLPFPCESFSAAVSNSVLEHIPLLDPVLQEMRRVLKPGAPFIFCVPNDRFLEGLSIARTADRAGLHPLGRAYRAFFNWISRHHHCDSPEIWQARLQKAGFEIERWWHYFSPEALRVFEWGHYFSAPCLIPHFLLGRWTLFPSERSLAPIRRLVQPYYDNPVCDDGVYTFYIARRI